MLEWLYGKLYTNNWFPQLELFNDHTIIEIMIIIKYCCADVIGGWSVYSNNGIGREETSEIQ